MPAFDVEFTLDDVADCPAAPVATRNGPDDPAHILFTSGSTGTPKGVVITHANVMPFIEWAVKYFGMDSTDRVSAHPPLHFDMSFFDIFGSRRPAASCTWFPATLNLLPNKLADFIRASELTQWFSVPSVLNYLAKFDVVRLNDFPALRRVLWCGEVLPTPALIYWMKRLPHVQFTNLYGPTETTIASSYYTVPGVPGAIRRPRFRSAPPAPEKSCWCSMSRCGRCRRERPATCISAASGWRSATGGTPSRTDAVFVRDPQRPSERIYKTGDLARLGDDGLVYFLGRSDSQIKSRGYRIELGEIEAALNAVAGVEECAVVRRRTGGFEGVPICCAYVPAPGADADARHACAVS